MRTAIIIPARYHSKRLPAKPLLKSTGKYLVQHVYERASRSKRARYVIVATDDPRVAAAVESFGGDCVMTRGDHATGTDRVAEVAQDLDVDVIVNLQGDEPEVDPAALDLLPAMLDRDADADVATLAVPIADDAEWASPSCVKVVCDRTGRALYFSRAPIPFVRDGRPNFRARPARFLRHLGLYAYRRDYLLRQSQMTCEPLEEMERLEQLRWLAAGCRIQVGLVNFAPCGVDTLEEYEEFVRRFRDCRSAVAA
jgi:3-deoxy-manno-octulosonate cytidylyltransferase (CMP-KDO synthetase)